MTTRKARISPPPEDVEGGGMEMTSPVRTIRPTLEASAEVSEVGEDWARREEECDKGWR